MKYFSKKAPAPPPTVALSVTFIGFLAMALVWHYRLGADLSLRPMHADEAILAAKSADYVSSGRFNYDPTDFHGPLFHQLNRLWLWLCGASDPSLWTESLLRAGVAITSLVSLLACILFLDLLGPLALAMSLLLLAASPLLVYYSGYFIMESLLGFFHITSLAFLWRYIKDRSFLWLALLGLSLGWQHATKETFVLSLAAALPAALLVWALFASEWESARRKLPYGARQNTGTGRPWAWVLGLAALASVLSFSGGLSQWTAVLDSLRTYGQYLGRSGIEEYRQPWHYFLSLLTWHRNGLPWGEWLISALAIVGMGRGFLGKWRDGMARAFTCFLSLHALGILMLLSCISYKTPWCLLTVVLELGLLAGLGGAFLWNALQAGWSRWALRLGLLCAVYSQCEQADYAVGAYRADARNPFCYSHPSTDLLKMVADLQPKMEQRPNCTAQVIQRDSGWPLPWYWRHLPNIGYFADYPSMGLRGVDAIVVEEQWLAKVQEQLGAALSQYDLSRPYGMRPGILLHVLWRREPSPGEATRLQSQEAWLRLAKPPHIGLPRLMPNLPKAESSILKPLHGLHKTKAP